MKRNFSNFQWIATNNGAETPPVTTPPAPPAPPQGKTFTEAELNAAVAKQAETLKAERQKVIEQYQQLQKAHGATETQVKEYQAQIDQLTSMNLTKEEQARVEAEKLKKSHQTELETVGGERDKWRGEYTNYRVENEILKAAGEANAFSPQQLVDLLAKRTKLIEQKETVNGQAVTIYRTIVKYDGKDKDGKPVVLDLTVSEAIKAMRENPEQYGNLFKTDAKGGTGLLNNQPGAPATGSGYRPGMQFDEYMKQRKSQFGSNIK